MNMNPLSLLEHVNLNIPDHSYKEFYYRILRLAQDPRRCTLDGKGTIWANAGACQLHLPEGVPAQVLPGKIGLLYKRGSLASLQERLEDYSRLPLVEKSKFAWKPDGSSINIVGPYGNHFIACGAEDIECQPWHSMGVQPNGEAAEACGMHFVEVFVRRSAAAGLAAFYRHYFNAAVKEEPGKAIISIGEESVRQTLIFSESSEEGVAYDGHHICIYLAAGFEESFTKLHQRGLIFVNPRPRFGCAKTLEGARREKQYR
ncbi:unnamed protein product [Chrysoparadoxa australica]